MRKFISKDLLLAIVIDLVSLFIFGVITADLTDGSIETIISVLSFFLVLALVNVYFFFRYKKSLKQESTNK